MPYTNSRSSEQSTRQPSSSHRARHHRQSRSRSRSPHHGKHSHRIRDRERSESHYHRRIIERRGDHAPKPLPLNATPLSKHGLSTYRPLFGLYLDIQKQLDIEDLTIEEEKGRWKSFVKKWNAGDLAEGWYDPVTFEKATQGTFGQREGTNPLDSRKTSTVESSTQDEPYRDIQNNDSDPDEDKDEEDFGPALPKPLSITSSTYDSSKIGHDGSNSRSGPSVPSTTDLRIRDEEALETMQIRRDASLASLRDARKTDRKLQRERLDDLAPRAEAGTRERQLEKRREVAASNRAFATANDGGGDVDLRDADVMGDDDSLGELKRMKEVERRKKNDREVRREEVLRARAAEREERVKGMREKEAKTMEMLKSIARARFGDGGG